MRYISTRGGVSEPRSFTDILLEGLAPDGGLYVPESYPYISLAQLLELRGKSYQDVALLIMHLFAPEIPESELRRMIMSAYTAKKFGSHDITPINRIANGVYIQELSNGPTLAFKDLALQLVAELMEYALRQRGETLNILAATSGDTGSAAEEAFKNREGINVFMLSPGGGRMSEFQAAQMRTNLAQNIHNLMLDEPFDTCQTIVKQVNQDAAFKARYRIGAVNSINWARIAAQVAYYVHGWVRMAELGYQRISFAVPSGNFGNALACHVAQRMGMPIHRIIVATNENDVLARFFNTGMYRPWSASEVVSTSSPSMDIAVSSNFERFVHDLCDRNGDRVRSLWEQLGPGGPGAFSLPAAAQRRFPVVAGTASMQHVLATIRWAHRHERLIDPHTAVGMAVALTLLHSHDHSEAMVVMETARPAKFAETIVEAIGTMPPLPPGFEDLLQRPQQFDEIAATPAAVKEIIMTRAA